MKGVRRNIKTEKQVMKGVRKKQVVIRTERQVMKDVRKGQV